MSNKIPIRIIVILSAAVLSIGIGFLIPKQQQAYAYNNRQNTQSDLRFPGSNADDYEPTTTLTSMIKDIVISIFKTIQD